MADIRGGVEAAGTIDGVGETGDGSFNRALLDNGKYTFWGYEHLYLPSSTLFRELAQLPLGLGQVLVLGLCLCCLPCALTKA